MESLTNNEEHLIYQMIYSGESKVYIAKEITEPRMPGKALSFFKKVDSLFKQTNEVDIHSVETAINVIQVKLEKRWCYWLCSYQLVSWITGSDAYTISCLIAKVRETIHKRKKSSTSQSHSESNLQTPNTSGTINSPNTDPHEWMSCSSKMRGLIEQSMKSQLNKFVLLQNQQALLKFVLLQNQRALLFYNPKKQEIIPQFVLGEAYIAFVIEFNFHDNRMRLISESEHPQVLEIYSAGRKEYTWAIRNALLSN